MSIFSFVSKQHINQRHKSKRDAYYPQIQYIGTFIFMNIIKNYFALFGMIGSLVWYKLADKTDLTNLSTLKGLYQTQCLAPVYALFGIYLLFRCSNNGRVLKSLAP